MFSLELCDMVEIIEFDDLKEECDSPKKRARTHGGSSLPSNANVKDSFSNG